MLVASAPRGGRWAALATAAVAEQGLSSVSFLLVHVTLGRWTSPEAYGEFAIAFAVMVLVELLHRASFGEPAQVFLARYGRRRGLGYFRMLFGAHLVVALLMASAVAAFAAILQLLGQKTLSLSVIGLALALIPLLSASLLRRMCYATLHVPLALVGGAVNLVAVAAGMFTIRAIGSVSPFTAFLVLGLGSVVLSVLVAARLGIPLGHQPAGPTGKRALADHARYSRSATPAALLSWIPVHLYYLALPFLDAAGVAASGQLRAGVTMFMPILQVNGAIGTLLVATFAARLSSHVGLGTTRLIGGLCGLSVGYWVLMLGAGPWLLARLYGSAFLEAVPALPILGALPVLTAAAHVIRSQWLARNRPDLVLRSQGLAALVSVAVGLAMASRWGIQGAAAGMVLAVTGQTVLLAWYLLRDRQNATVD